MMKTTTLRRQAGGTKAAANGTVPRARRASAASEGAAEASSEWLEAERAIWAQTERPLSDDRRFVLIGNLVTITKQGRWKGAWGFVRSAKDGWVTVELSSFAADGSVIELPAEHVTLDRLAGSESYQLAVRSAALSVGAKSQLSDKVANTMQRRAKWLEGQLAWLKRNSEMRTLTHQSAMRKLGITSNHITAIVPWTGGAK